MEVYFNKKSDKEISKQLLLLKLRLGKNDFKNNKEKIKIKTQYETLKWVVGENEK